MTPKEFAKKIIASINPGTADIIGIGDGTIKGAISELNKKIAVTEISQEIITVEAKASTGIIGSAYAYFDITNIIEDDVIYIIPISATKVGSPGTGALISKYHQIAPDPLCYAWVLAAPSEGQYTVTFLFFHK